MFTSNMVLPASSAHASNKGCGRNKTKPPRPPHRNTMIDVRVLGCGPIRTGEGAAAQFNGVHIQGGIRPAGRFDTLSESRWADLIGPSIPAKKSTIQQSTIEGLFMFGNWQCDGTAALFVATEIRGILDAWVG